MSLVGFKQDCLSDAVSCLEVAAKSYDYLEQRGTVDEQINPRERGRVKYRNTIYFAICPENITLLPGQPCQVVDIHTATLTLVVKPVNLDRIR